MRMQPNVAGFVRSRKVREPGSHEPSYEEAVAFERCLTERASPLAFARRFNSWKDPGRPGRAILRLLQPTNLQPISHCGPWTVQNPGCEWTTRAAT